MNVFLKTINDCLSVVLSGHQHSISPINSVFFLFHLLNLLNSLYSLNVCYSVVSDGLCLSLLELEQLVVGQFLPCSLSISLGPFEFLGVVFGLEVSVALRSAESEDFAVVSHELHSMSWVYWGPAEKTLFYSHIY